MNFHPSIKTISQYQDGLLSEENLSKINRHLSSCNSCRKIVSLLHSPVKELEPQSGLLEQISDNVMKSLVEPAWNEGSDITGEILSATGDAFINNKTLQRVTRAVPGFSLCRNDAIITADTGKVLVRLNDGSHLYINKSTEIDFSDKKYNLLLDRGELFAMMKPQPSKFVIKTPAAALTVVGTDFDTIVTDTNETILKVFKGSVNFKSSSGEVLVGSKYQAMTGKSGKPVASRIKNGKSASSWTGSLEPSRGSGGNKGSGLKGIIAAVLAIILVVGVWSLFKPQTKPEDARLVSGTASSSKAPTPHRVLQGLTGALGDVYKLESGEIIKLIKPPFNESREEFFREQGYTGDEVARSMFIADNWGELKMQGSIYGGDPSIKTIVSMITRLDRNYIEGDDSLLNKQHSGDYVYISTATAEEKMSALENLLSGQLGYPISLEFREVPRDIYVARGNFKFQPRTPGEERIILSPPSNITSNAFSETSNVTSHLEQIERGLYIKIKNEVIVDPNLSIKLVLESGGNTRSNVDSYLEQFTEQTGITFTKELAPVRILFVEKAGDSFAGNLEGFLKSMESIKNDLTYKQKEDLKEFAETYSLLNSENFKIIKDIDTHGRKTFFDIQDIGMRYDDISTYILRWKDGMPEMRAMMYGPIQFRTLIGFVTVLPRDEIEGDEEILSTKLGGDLVYREFETMDEKFRMLEEYYEKEFGSKIRISFRKADRNAVVGKGQFELNPLNSGSDVIVIKSGRFATKRIMTGTFDDLIKIGADFYEFRFANEIDSPPESVKWKIDNDRTLAKKGYKYYLEQISQQTGVTFTEENRPTQVLHIIRE